MSGGELFAEGRDGKSRGQACTLQDQDSGGDEDLLAALVQVQKLPGGQRELIERMIAAYEAKYPADVNRASEIMALLVPSDYYTVDQ